MKPQLCTQNTIKALIATTALTLTSCATGGLSLAPVPETRGTLITPRQTCKPAVTRTVAYGLFVMPINSIDQQEISSAIPADHTITEKEYMRPRDILYTILGFMFSIVTKTHSIEDCGPSLLAYDTGLNPDLLKASLPVRIIYNRGIKHREGTYRVLLRSLQRTPDGKAVTVFDGNRISIPSADEVQIQTEAGWVRVPAADVLVVEYQIEIGALPETVQK